MCRVKLWSFESKKLFLQLKGMNELNEKSRTILELIAEGYSYDQILQKKPNIKYLDIFQAAAEALEVVEQFKSGSSYEQRMTEIRQAHPRAYDKWSNEEDATLKKLFQSGSNAKAIADQLKRQPSAIRSRLAKFGLIGNL
jgi:DNA-binding NarL/FixJ family response regulator